MKTNTPLHHQAVQCGICYLFAFLSLWISQAAMAEIEEWGCEKGPGYKQVADNTAPTAPIRWEVSIWVDTADAGDAASVRISKNGSTASFDLTQDDGEWELEKTYPSEAAMNAEFPDGATYTITLSGGSLGTKTQTFNMGARSYPDTPYLTGRDLSRLRSLDAESPFTLHWSS